MAQADINKASGLLESDSPERRHKSRAFGGEVPLQKSTSKKQNQLIRSQTTYYKLKDGEADELGGN